VTARKALAIHDFESSAERDEDVTSAPYQVLD